MQRTSNHASLSAPLNRAYLYPFNAARALLRHLHTTPHQATRLPKTGRQQAWLRGDEHAKHAPANDARERARRWDVPLPAPPSLPSRASLPTASREEKKKKKKNKRERRGGNTKMSPTFCAHNYTLSCLRPLRGGSFQSPAGSRTTGRYPPL